MIQKMAPTAPMHSGKLRLTEVATSIGCPSRRTGRSLISFLPIERRSMKSTSSPSRTRMYAAPTIPPMKGMRLTPPASSPSMRAAMKRLARSALAPVGAGAGTVLPGVAMISSLWTPKQKTVSFLLPEA